jgi:hypothetical protein
MQNFLTRPLIRWTSGTVEFGWIELCAPSLRPWHCFLVCTWLDFRGACVHTACLCVTRGLSSVGRVEPLSLAGLSFVRPVCDLGTASCSRLARLSRSLSAYCLSLRNPGPLIRWTSGTVEFGWIELCAHSLRPWPLIRWTSGTVELGRIELCAPSLRPWPLIRWTSGTVELGRIELCAPSLRPWYCSLLCTWLDFRGI